MNRFGFKVERLMALSLTALLLGGCANTGQFPPQSRNNKAMMQDIQSAFADGEHKAAATPAGKPPQSVSAALLPPINVNVPGVDKAATEPRFDVKVRHVRARDFFLGLVAGTPYNMVVNPHVGGYISLDLKNVTVKEVLDTVRNVFGYDYERTATGFEVLPNTIRTKLFYVNYLDFKRDGTSKTHAAPGQVTNAGSTNGTGTNTGGTTTQQDDSGSTIDTTSQSDFWSDLSKNLKIIVGDGKGRRVSVSPQSGLVMVRAMPNELHDVAEYLKATQNVVQRQVIIEARVLEVELNDNYQAGINWSALHTNTGDIGVLDFSGSSGNSFTGGASGINGARSYGSTATFGGPFTLAVNAANFSALIDMLKGQGKVHVLSSPRVSTVNNQKAVIKVGKDNFYVTGISSNTSTSATATTSSNVTLTPFFSGVTLDVIPQINAKGEIILYIHPAVSNVTEEQKEIPAASGGAPVSVPLAASTIRETDTVIRARSGQVVVLGGLMQTQVQNTPNGVPFFGDLPLVGGLFRHEAQVKKKTELVILLKPVVVGTDDQWSAQVRNSHAQFKALAQGSE